MADLTEVMQGLKQGRSFKREDEEGTHYAESDVVDPNLFFVHTWLSSAEQGGGGTADLAIATLGNGRWPADGWEEYIPQRSA